MAAEAGFRPRVFDSSCLLCRCMYLAKDGNHLETLLNHGLPHSVFTPGRFFLENCAW